MNSQQKPVSLQDSLTMIEPLTCEGSSGHTIAFLSIFYLEAATTYEARFNQK